MDNKNIDRPGLQKKAGLKEGVLRNILSKRSLNPTIKVISAIANALDCKVDDLINYQSENFLNDLEKEIDSSQWNHDLASSCIKTIGIFFKDKGFYPNVKQANFLIKEIYNYSLRKESRKQNRSIAEIKSCQVDEDYTEWVVNQLIDKLR
jgi:transcriptional regulator with XRE-family HTH domain